MNVDYHRSTTLALKGWACTVGAFSLLRACEPPAKAELPTITVRQPATLRPASLPAPSDGLQCTLADAPVGPWPDRLGVLLEAPVTRDEEKWVLASIDTCGQTNREVADPWLVLALLRLEGDLGVPSEAHGLLPAIWCKEASMRTASPSGRPVRGDFHNHVAASKGPMQTAAWQTAWCGMRPESSDNLLAAAECWVLRTEFFLEAKTKECGARNAWRVSEAWTANPLKYKWLGCRAASSHFEQLDRVHALMQPVASTKHRSAL